MSNTLNRAFETTTTSGTGQITLLGAIASYDDLVTAAIRDIGATSPQSWTIYYVIADSTSYEMGTGTLTGGATPKLTRDSVIASSNSDALVNFGANVKNVWSFPPESALVPAPGLTYAAISASTALAVETDYADTSTADRSHTLPELSTTSAGDRIRVTALADGEKIIKHHANDSSGAPMTVLFKKHDSCEFISTGTAWGKRNEKFSGFHAAHLTADDSVSSGGGEELVFDSDVTIDRNDSGAWSAGVWTHKTTWPDCSVRMSVVAHHSHSGDMFTSPAIGGVMIHEDHTTGANQKVVTTGAFVTGVTGTNALSFRTKNNNGSTQQLMGDVADDESQCTLEIVSWDL